jgi:acetyl-CoA carboxylase carboxyltransferase component
MVARIPLCLSHALLLACRALHRCLQRAAERGFVDAIIDPKDTRRRLCEDLETLRTKEWTGLKKKHGNIPL